MDQITRTFNDPNSIVDVQARSYVKNGVEYNWNSTIRETFVIGPYGQGVVIKTGWEGNILREIMVSAPKAP